MTEAWSAAPLLGLVLAGGRSARLGPDKAAIELDGATLLERAVRELSAVLQDVRVAVRSDQLHDRLRSRFGLVADAGEGIGPAAGVLAAHSLDPSAAWLVLACDMPRVTAAVLRTLVAQRDPQRPATAFRAAADGLPEPLCAIYEPATLARFRAQVEAHGGSSLRLWLAAAGAQLLDNPGSGVLGSVNTPQDLQGLVAAGPLARPAVRVGEKGSQ